jgi:hypothetical protein
MEDPTTPSSRDPPTAPSSPVVSSYPGVPFASFERASAHVQGRFHDAYAFAKRFGDQPLGAHTLAGHLPASARSSEVVSAALKSLGAKTRSVEQDRNAWRAKYEDAQRELLKVAAERDEEAAKRAEDSSARRHQSRSASPKNVASPPNASPSPQTVRARVKRIEGFTDVVRSESVTTHTPDRDVNDDGDGGALPSGRAGSGGRDAASQTTPTAATLAEPAKSKKENDASLVLGFTRADLEAATRRAETAEAALRASEAAHASDTIRATAHSEIGMLKTQLAAARAEHAARTRELDASWSARLRLAEEAAEKNRAASASAASGEISTRREAKDAREEEDGATDKNTREARLAARVRELESVVAALTSTMSRAPRRIKRRAFRAKPRRQKNIHPNPNPRASSSSLRGDSYSSDEWESAASDSDSDARAFGSVSEPARLPRGRARDARSGRAEAPARRRGKKPWGSGFATSRADGALGLSPSRAHRENDGDVAHAERRRDGETARRELRTGRMDETLRTKNATAKVFSRPPPRPPFRAAAKRATAAPTPTAVARAAGGFSYPGDGAEERQRQRHAREADARRKRENASVSGGIGAAERRSDSRTLRVAEGLRRAKVPPAPPSNVSDVSSDVSLVSGVSRARSMEALKRARAAAKRRVATVAAARSGSITASPAASLAPSPAASPARPVRRGDDGDASLAALRAEFEATREEYSRLALGVLGSDSGAALDDVIERLQEVSAAIAKRVRATA